MSLRHPNAAINRPRRQDFHYKYNGQTIKYSLWSTSTNLNITTIVFLGTVQIGKLPLWVAQQCPPNTVVAQGAPHWFAKDDGSDVPEFILRFTQEVYVNIFGNYNIKKLRVIADSQAVPGLLSWAAGNNQSSIITQLALLQPLGLNADVFKGAREDRIRLFKKRVATNFRYQLRSLLFDRRLMHNHGQTLKTVGYNNSKSDAQYNTGLMHDSLEDLKKISATGTQIVVICGKNDTIFPSQEIKHTLQKNKLSIPLIVVPAVPHSPLATRHGMRLLNTAFEYFE